MTFARVLKSKKPVPSNNFINEPVVESRPSANNTNRPLACKYSAMRLTAYAELVSTVKVRLLIMIQRCSQVVCAAVLEVTKRQSSSREAPRNNQSIHET